MKLKKFLIVAASTLLLSACGGGTGPGTLPKGGQPATAASTIAAIGNAYESLTAMDLDAVEANLNLKKVKVDAKVPTIIDDVEGYTVVKAEAAMKAKLGVVGLQSETLAGLKAVAKVDGLSFDVYAGIELDGQKEVMADINHKGIDFAAYIANGNLYANISDAELRGLIPEILTTFLGMPATKEQIDAVMEELPGKIQIPDIIPQDILPLLGSVGGLVNLEDLPSSEEIAELLADTINEPVFAILEDYVSLLDYDDGSFGIGIDLTKADVLSLLKILVPLMGDGISSQEVELIVAEYAKVFEIKSFKITALLNKDALPSDLLVDIDVSVDTSLSELMAEDGVDVKLGVALKADLKVKYGRDVSVVLPTDLASYQVMGFIGDPE